MAEDPEMSITGGSQQVELDLFPTWLILHKYSSLKAYKV